MSRSPISLSALRKPLPSNCGKRRFRIVGAALVAARRYNKIIVRKGWANSCVAARVRPTHFYRQFPLAIQRQRLYDNIMEQLTTKKRGLAAIFALSPLRHVLLLLSTAVIAAHRLTRSNRALNVRLSEYVIRPLHRSLGRFNSVFPFSVAELLIALAVGALAAFLCVQTVRLVRRPERSARLYRLVLTLVSCGLAVYALFCLLWGVFYYGDDFAARSGLSLEPVSVEQLEAVTRYFADLANTYAARVDRDENGVYTVDRQALLDKSPEVFRKTAESYPCLDGPALRAKGIRCSRVMSALDFTGFFFPFTAEANVNMDFPPALLASTIAHELSHQRCVAKEQEANFCAVLASLDYGDPDYVYSAALLAYTHLGNALYAADYAAWESVYRSLSEPVLRDFDANRAYWQQFETPVQTVSDTVYENFLFSYDQQLGLKSYGACVDLLVNYYLPKAY